MSKTELVVESYVGIDIGETLVERNGQEFSNASTSFRCLNLAEDDLPVADLIFSRDCLAHLSFNAALGVTANSKRSDAKYLPKRTFT